jgi:hypothetical protein
VLGSSSEFFNTYVNPGVGFTMPEHVQQITGLDVEYLLDNGCAFEEAWAQFVQWLLTQRSLHAADINGPPPSIVLLAHNGRQFDFPLLAQELRRHGILSNGDESTSGAMGLYLESYGVACLVDTLQVLRDQKLWKELEEEAKGQTGTLAFNAIQIQTDISVDPEKMDSADRLWTRGGVSQSGEVTIARVPSKFSQMGLYEEIFGKKFDSAHNALADVQALDDILSVPFIHGRWRRFANGRQFRL